MRAYLSTSTVILLLSTALISSCSQETLKPHDHVEVAAVSLNAGALSDDGRYAVAGSNHNGISLWRLDDGERLYDWSHQENLPTTLISADFSPDRRWVITADTHTMALWDLQTGEAPRFWKAPGEIYSVQISRNGTNALLGLSNHTAVLFDIQRGGVLRTLNHTNRVRSVALSEDGTKAVTGSEGSTATAWSLSTGQVQSRMQHEDEVQLVALSDDGQLAFSASRYDKAVIWNTTSGELHGELPIQAERRKRGQRFTAARFSPDKKFLLTGRPDQTVTLWRVADLTIMANWQVPKRKVWKPSGAVILDVAFSQEPGHYRAMASNGFVFELQLPQQYLIK